MSISKVSLNALQTTELISHAILLLRSRRRRTGTRMRSSAHTLDSTLVVLSPSMFCYKLDGCPSRFKKTRLQPWQKNKWAHSDCQWNRRRDYLKLSVRKFGWMFHCKETRQPNWALSHTMKWLETSLPFILEIRCSKPNDLWYCSLQQKPFWTLSNDISEDTNWLKNHVSMHAISWNTSNTASICFSQSTIDANSVDHYSSIHIAYMHWRYIFFFVLNNIQRW